MHTVCRPTQKEKRWGWRNAHDSSVLDSTSRLAGETAAKLVGSRQSRIMQLLHDRGGMTIFEVAGTLRVFDHQISGRFSELERRGKIRKSGQRRRKPDTTCECEVYVLCEDASDKAATPPRGDLLGYPDTVVVPGEGPFDRDEPLGAIDAAGVPYVRRGPGLRETWRFAFMECEGCGRPVREYFENAGGSIENGVSVPRKRRVFRCGTEGCKVRWQALIVSEPGKAPLLALVAKTR